MSKVPIAKRLARRLWPETFDLLEKADKAYDEAKTDLAAAKAQLAYLRPTVEAEVKAAIAEANKPKWREHLLFAFEKNGHQYSRFDSSVNMPLGRYDRLQKFLIHEGDKLSPENSELLLRIWEAAMEKLVNTGTKDGKIRLSYLNDAMFVVREFRHRRDDDLAPPDIYCELFAICLIRDDENPEVIDPYIHEEKKEGFRQWGGEEAFFTASGLGTLIPRYELLKPSWNELWEKQKNLEKLRNSTYGKILDAIKCSTSENT